MRRLFLGLTALFLCSGCQDSGPTLSGLYPVNGKVIQNGKPVTGGGLLFVAEEGGRGGCIFDASVNPDGTYEARTSRLKDTPVIFYPGLPRGKYKLIYHPGGNGAVTGTQIESKVRLTVEETRNQIEIELPDGGAGEKTGVPRDDDPNSPAFDPNRDDK